MDTKKTIKVQGRLFNVGGDAKTVKGQKSGVLTAICYMAPAGTVATHHPELAGVNLCAWSTAGCRAACLTTAGRGQMGSVQQGRARKAHLFLTNRAQFRADVLHDLRRLAKRATREGMELHLRPDGTTDVLTVWLGHKWEGLLDELTPHLTPAEMTTLRNARRYTYTKRPAKHFANLANTHVTYSWNEGADNRALAMGHLAAGNNIAVVFRTRAMVEHALVHGFNGQTVVDGDADDNRTNDPSGVVVALYAKGRGKRDTSGFVVDIGPVRHVKGARARDLASEVA